MRLLLHFLDTLSKLLAFIFVFFGLWMFAIGNDVTAGIVIGSGILLGAAGFFIGKKLERKPRGD